MCHQVVCERCLKPTWSGCGNHIDQALAGVAPGDRCTCDHGFAASSAEALFARFSGAES